MVERQKLLSGLKRIEGYFLRNCENHELFRPEYECALKINEQLVQKDRLSTSDAEYIVSIYNETNKGEHYAGSGWIDFQMHLCGLLKVDGIDLEIEAWTGGIKII